MIQREGRRNEAAVGEDKMIRFKRAEDEPQHRIQHEQAEEDNGGMPPGEPIVA